MSSAPYQTITFVQEKTNLESQKPANHPTTKTFYFSEMQSKFQISNSVHLRELKWTGVFIP